MKTYKHLLIAGSISLSLILISVLYIDYQLNKFLDLEEEKISLIHKKKKSILDLNKINTKKEIKESMDNPMLQKSKTADGEYFYSSSSPIYEESELREMDYQNSELQFSENEEKSHFSGLSPKTQKADYKSLGFQTEEELIEWLRKEFKISDKKEVSLLAENKNGKKTVSPGGEQRKK